MRRRFMALGVAAAMLALTACSGGGPSEGGDSSGATAGDSLTIGENSYPTSWDITGVTTGHDVLYFGAVYDTLLRIDGDGNLVPGLATVWEYDDARTTLTLTLREDVAFTDGTEFNADAVVANIENFQASSTADLSQAQYVTGVEAVDPTHVAISLSTPDPGLVTWLSGSLGFMASPAHFDSPDVAIVPVGTGPYTLDTSATVTGSTYVFQKNPNYWDDSQRLYDTLTINFYETPTALLNAIQGKQVNAATFSDFSSLSQVEAADYTVNTSQLDWSGMIIYDRDGAVDSPLGDVRVRQAINYAIDRQGILDTIILGHGTTTSSPFGASTAGFDESLDSYYPYDPAKAKELLADAGYADGFALTMPSSSIVDQSLLTTIQQQLADVGIVVNYSDTSSNFVTDLLAGKFTSSWMQLASPSDWHFAQTALLPTSAWNPFGTETDETEALLATMQSGTDEEADAAAKELNRYVTENAWFAPFFRIDNLFVSDESVSVTMATNNATPYLYLIQPAS